MSRAPRGARFDRVAGWWAVVSLVAMVVILVCGSISRPAEGGVSYGSRMLEAPEMVLLAIVLAGFPLASVSFVRKDDSPRAGPNDVAGLVAVPLLLMVIGLNAFFVGRMVLSRATESELVVRAHALDVTVRVAGVALHSLHLRDDDLSSLRMELAGYREMVSKNSTRPVGRAELIAVLRDGGEAPLGYGEWALYETPSGACVPSEWGARAEALARGLSVPLTYARVERTQHPLQSSIAVPECAAPPSER